MQSDLDISKHIRNRYYFYFIKTCSFNRNHLLNPLFLLVLKSYYPIVCKNIYYTNLFNECTRYLFLLDFMICFTIPSHIRGYPG